MNFQICIAADARSMLRTVDDMRISGLGVSGEGLVLCWEVLLFWVVLGISAWDLGGALCLSFGVLKGLICFVYCGFGRVDLLGVEKWDESVEGGRGGGIECEVRCQPMLSPEARRLKCQVFTCSRALYQVAGSTVLCQLELFSRL